MTTQELLSQLSAVIAAGSLSEAEALLDRYYEERKDAESLSAASTIDAVK